MGAIHLVSHKLLYEDDEGCIQEVSSLCQDSLDVQLGPDTYLGNLKADSKNNTCENWVALMQLKSGVEIRLLGLL